MYDEKTIRGKSKSVFVAVFSSRDQMVNRRNSCDMIRVYKTEDSPNFHPQKNRPRNFHPRIIVHGIFTAKKNDPGNFNTQENFF